MQHTARTSVCTTRRQWLAAAAALATLPLAHAQSPGVQDEAWTDSARQRSLPVRIRWPATSPASGADGLPAVLFSHGLGGTRAGGEVWGEAWAAAGFLVIHLQHPGSDFEAVRSAAGSFGNRAGLASVAGPEQLLARLLDVRFAVDEIGRRHAAAQPGWSAVRMDRLGLSGHSFGAHTTLGAAGQRYPGAPPLDEPRLAAFIAFSPTVPARGDAAQAFAGIQRPMLCITGTRDDDVVGNGSTPDRRAAVFGALPAGSKALLLLKDADHMSFAGQSSRAIELIRRDAAARRLQPAHHALVSAITTDWWRARLLGDAAAAERLQRPAGLLPEDLWQTG